MSNFAVVKDGVVVNVVVADNDKIVLDVSSKQFGTYITAHECVGDNEYVGIGWSYDGAVFTQPETEPTE